MVPAMANDYAQTDNKSLADTGIQTKETPVSDDTVSDETPDAGITFPTPDESAEGKKVQVTMIHHHTDTDDRNLIPGKTYWLSSLEAAQVVTARYADYTKD